MKSQKTEGKHRIRTGNKDTIKIATWNIRGIAESTKRQVITKIMKKKGIDILCLQETWNNINSRETIEGYNFVFSTSVDNKDREERIKRTQQRGRGRGKGRGKGKEKGKSKGKGKSDLRGLETHGVGMVFAPRIWRAMEDLEQKGGRLMLAKIKTNNVNTCVINAYCPQSLNSTEEKEKHYYELAETYKECRKSNVTVIIGDMNVRLQARAEGEEKYLENTSLEKAWIVWTRKQ